jgi:dTDP-4-amino-4,6-dideoxygalactose transaminase
MTDVSVPPSQTASTSAPIPMLDFSRQYNDIREEVLAAIAQVCDSQRFILGPAVDHFEQSAAHALSVPHSIGCASGTDALWLALASSGIGSLDAAVPSSDAVITSPFSFFASVSAILRAGARPLLADIDPLTFNLSPSAVAALLETPAAKNVRAILPVHLYGQCADMDALKSLQRNHPNLLLIEDAAQAFGSEWNNTPAGALGDAAAFSFYPTKNLSAFGDAGLLTTPSAAIDTRARSLRSHGMTRRYYHDEIGWNSRLDSIQAAILEVKLRHLPRWNQRRRDLAARYDHLFQYARLVGKTIADGIVPPWTDPRATHIYHQYVIRAPRRDALREYLTSRQIGSEIYYPLPLHLQTSLTHLGYKKGYLPHAEAASEQVLALPIYPELREDEQHTVVEAIRTFYA